MTWRRKPIPVELWRWDGRLTLNSDEIPDGLPEWVERLVKAGRISTRQHSCEGDPVAMLCVDVGPPEMFYEVDQGPGYMVVFGGWTIVLINPDDGPGTEWIDAVPGECLATLYEWEDGI